MEVKDYIEKITNLSRTDPEQAMKICDEALAQFPNDAQLYYQKALILWDQSEVFDLPRQQFTALLKKATDLDPHYSEPHYLWAYANELLGYPDLALQGYARAVEANPNDIEALGKMGEMKQKLGDFPGALEAFDKLIAVLPNPSDRAYNSRGQVRREMKNYSEAIEDFNKALKINPNAGGSFWGRGLCKKELSDLAGALEDFSQMIKLFPQYVFGYMERAAVKVLQNDLIGALKDYQAVVLQVDPKNDDAWEHIADLQNQLSKQIPEGAQVLRSTLKSGHTAMTAPVNGEMVLFLDMPQQESAPVAEPQISKKETQIDKKELQKRFVDKCRWGKLEELKEMLAAGADVNTPNSFNDLPLKQAVLSDKPDHVELLLQHGATVTPSILALAENHHNGEIISLLKSFSAKE